MPRVLVPIATGFEEIEAITIIDVLRRADIEVVTAGLERKCVKGAHGIEIKTEAHLDDISSRDFDMIVLPGGMPGSANLKSSEKVLTLLGEMDQGGKYIGAICAAPIALAEAEVLKSTYTCYPSFEENITNATYMKNEDVVCNQNIITANGPKSAIQFSLEIVEKLCNKKIMENIKRQLLL